ncbi:MAG: thioredoxin [Rhodobacteraceae bacterium]|nr:MAG: thioredoxin [Paracoccaceae bacterium]
MKKQRKSVSAKKKPAAAEHTQTAQPSRRQMLLYLRNGAIGVAALSVGGWGAAHAYQTHVERHELSVIGNGIATVVQIHDPQCPTCRALQKETLRAARSFEDDVLQVRVANIRTAEGRAMADRYGVPHVTLLLFDGAGEMQDILSGPNNRQFLRAQFSAHIARHTGA